MSLGRAAATVGGGAVMVAGGFYLGYASLLRKSNKESPPTEKERRDTFDKLATVYDNVVYVDEAFNGVQGWRRRLIQKARGDVLEVAIGTGRNFDYYLLPKVKSITGTDFSRPMLKVAEQKKAKIDPIPLRLVVSNCLKMTEFPDETFDSVVDTFGICSYEKPVESLREMGRVLKKDGELLLLEHGQAVVPAITNYLNKKTIKHAKKFGCFYDRDILSLVDEAGFDVKEVRRRHFGTTYMITAVKPRGGLRGSRRVSSQLTEN
uniref:Methyltransferase type 11 domain-containing protein n=1 Tax=Chromera velia CCMP2878 TaxID=1169474 RepID=A0A0G4F9L0_9ALVE|eukprot:Cvel_15784.t1-p1 / transcript=Cvel_15784.t1 / gene=Cvel_15784 / organism=Chromera_velia_CCMP2878 / gene_product=Uncharacterized methyltransferase C3B9.04,, putative / transcript_product=Uncharacterized methyltransferase C3B9.04,, putative / location=Cvel_scaffold1184:26890-33042(-) / protein_length=262 / sequence_SO=supercontig / SO=protein_coding / is_pseudo=false